MRKILIALLLALMPISAFAGSAGTGPGAAHVIVTGGTSVVIVKGPVNGCYVTNPYNAAGQGIVTAENLYVDPVGTPGSSDAAAIGTTVILQPGQNYFCPPFAMGLTLKANAATSGHALTVVQW